MQPLSPTGWGYPDWLDNDQGPVVQVYAEPPGLLLERPQRSLVGFARVALGPGDCRRLQLLIPLRQLAYFDEASSHFLLEAGCHRLRVGQHSEDGGGCWRSIARQRIWAPDQPLPSRRCSRRRL